MNPDFSRIARAYRWMEYCSFGPWLERCRFAQIGHLGDPRRALVLGDGDGRFVARLLRHYPLLKAEVIELSSAMIALAEGRVARVGAASRASFLSGDVRELHPPDGARYDLVAAHFFLDCLTDAELASLLERLQPALAPGAIFLISEFAIPARGPLRWAARLLVGTLYRSFRALTGLRVRRLPDYADALQARDFRPVETRLFLGGILRSERWRYEP